MMVEDFPRTLEESEKAALLNDHVIYGTHKATTLAPPAPSTPLESFL